MYLCNGVGRPIRYWTGWCYSINWLLGNGWYNLLEQLLKGRPAFKVLHIQSKSLLWKWHNRKTTTLWMWSSKLLRQTGLAILCNNSTWWTMCTPNLWDADRYILEKESEKEKQNTKEVWEKRKRKKSLMLQRKKKKSSRTEILITYSASRNVALYIYQSIGRHSITGEASFFYDRHGNGQTIHRHAQRSHCSFGGKIGRIKFRYTNIVTYKERWRRSY